MKVASNATEPIEAQKSLEKAMYCVEGMSQRLEAVQRDDAPTITFSEAVSALKQIQVQEEPRRVQSMYGKRAAVEGLENVSKKERIEELKTRTKCMGCGKRGHWFKDRPQCIRPMHEKWP